jgi:ABC-2 type transport system permease protein
MYALFISMCAIALHFALDLAIAHLAFWVVDTWAFQHLKNITFSMVGGFNFPYDILSKNVRIIFEFLPFKFFYYTPISYILGIRSGVTALTQDLLQMILWTMLFIVIASLLWKKGLQKYGAYGM